MILSEGKKNLKSSLLVICPRTGSSFIIKVITGIDLNVRSFQWSNRFFTNTTKQ